MFIFISVLVSVYFSVSMLEKRSLNLKKITFYTTQNCIHNLFSFQNTIKYIFP